MDARLIIAALAALVVFTAGCAPGRNYTPDPNDPAYLARVKAHWERVRANEERVGRTYSDEDWAGEREFQEEQTKEYRAAEKRPNLGRPGVTVGCHTCSGGSFSSTSCSAR